VSLEAILWPIAGSAGELLTSDDLGRVRQCGGKTCRWMFVDRSKNRSRRWCDLKVCGNRTKARKLYRRKKGSFHARSAVELPLRSISDPSSFSGFDYTRLEVKRFEAKP